MTSTNVDPAEVQKFEQMATRWWDPEGEQRALHDLNPARLAYVREFVALNGARVIDVGCGAGLLSEALAAEGAQVTGIDLAAKLLKVARLHRHESGVEVDYQLSSAEDMASSHGGEFDALVCMEMLEHVPDPAAVVAACAELLKPGGMCVFSTINRTARAFAMAVVGAEYVMRLLPRGTHEYGRFIRPSELSRAARQSGLEFEDLRGLHYDPFGRRAWLAEDVSVNYLACFRKPS